LLLISYNLQIPQAWPWCQGRRQEGAGPPVDGGRPTGALQWCRERQETGREGPGCKYTDCFVQGHGKSV